MVRYQKGDIATLYNVYFFNDAAVMLPESKYELNSLLNMMMEKPYKIVLHGHTNSNARGRIILRNSEENFFSISSDIKESYGSAKELSKQRAETIKAWLIANGIDGTRIEIKAWGGTRMLYEKNSARAKQNVRVEVEVLEDGK
jgi:outer membrane protein OmpA-like peptidoglycan-associated protein